MNNENLSGQVQGFEEEINPETQTALDEVEAAKKASIWADRRKKIIFRSAIIGLGLILILLLLLWDELSRHGSEIEAVKLRADQAVAIASQASLGVTENSGRIDALEQQVAQSLGENQAQDGRLDDLGGQVACLDQTVAAIGNTASSAQKTADTAVARQNSRVQAENQQYKRMLAFIRGANPAFELCSKTDHEIDRLLNDGKWNVEGQIQTEYDRLMNAATQRAQRTAVSAHDRVDVATGLATQALAAGETAVSAVSQIAEQPTRRLGHSVTKSTKTAISEQVSAYYDTYGAPEE